MRAQLQRSRRFLCLPPPRLLPLPHLRRHRPPRRPRFRPQRFLRPRLPLLRLLLIRPRRFPPRFLPSPPSPFPSLSDLAFALLSNLRSPLWAFRNSQNFLMLALLGSNFKTVKDS